MLVATLFVGEGDEDEAEVLDRVTDGLSVEATLLDYSEGGSPTYRFEGDAADLLVLAWRVTADDN